jgi:hypothetical protein
LRLYWHLLGYLPKPALSILFPLCYKNWLVDHISFPQVISISDIDLWLLHLYKTSIDYFKFSTAVNLPPIGYARCDAQTGTYDTSLYLLISYACVLCSDSAAIQRAILGNANRSLWVEHGMLDNSDIQFL